MVSLNQLTIAKKDLSEKLDKREKEYQILKEDHHKLKGFCEQLQKEIGQLEQKSDYCDKLGSENQKIKEEHLRAIAKI